MRESLPNGEKMKEDKLINYIIQEWQKKGTIKDEKQSREYLDIILYLLSNYRLKCLLGTIIDVDDLAEKYYTRKKVK